MTAEAQLAGPTWVPDPDQYEHTAIGRYRAWAKTKYAVPHGDDYDSLWRWSVDDAPTFYRSIWEHFTLAYSGTLLPERRAAGFRDEWFPRVRCNYAENVLAGGDPDEAVIDAFSETTAPVSWTRRRLRQEVASLASALVELGVEQGSVVAGYLPNAPETVVAFLAAASLGAIWTSCPPEFGAQAALSRLSQVEPVVLFAVTGYVWDGRPVDRCREVNEIVNGLDTLKAVVHLPYGQFTEFCPDHAPDVLASVQSWDALVCAEVEARFERVPFGHPLYVLFSSGTTGPPKALIHGHGPMLAHHCKDLGLQLDVRAGDKMLWFTTTGWMMWNFMVGALLVGASIVLVDGSPLNPPTRLWRLCADLEVTHFGVSPSFLDRSRAVEDEIAASDLSAMRFLGVTGSPLSSSLARWATGAIKSHPLVGSISGGTDVCSILVGSTPITPVWSGEISRSALGLDVDCVEESGASIAGPGEMVVRNSSPAMQVRIWGDANQERVRSSYFERFPGLWHQGDFIERTPHGGWIITGRSDATLNRAGVRIGTGEIYDVMSRHFPHYEVMVVHVQDGTMAGELLMLLAPTDGSCVEESDIRDEVRSVVRNALSARHAPDRVVIVSSIPYTPTGKRMEVPVKRYLEGVGPSPLTLAQHLDDAGCAQLAGLRAQYTKRREENR